MRRVVALDGPAASGKSTTARRVAERLGFCHLNSGLIYRAITWLALRHGWSEEDPDFPDRIGGLRVEWEGGAPALDVRIEGEAPGAALQSPEVSARVSAIAASAAVRERALALLRAAAERYDVVCDGRDIGTVVFPDAPLKVFIVAAAEERARRRLLDHGIEPDPRRIAEEAERLRRRDALDAGRALAPLRKAEDAVELDTTDLTLEEAVERVVAMARRRGLVARPAPGSDPSASGRDAGG